MINWKSQANYYFADIGDLHLVLKEMKDCWQVSMGFWVHSSASNKRMMRPTSVITKFEKPCDLSQAQLLTETYMEEFIDEIVNDFKE